VIKEKGEQNGKWAESSIKPPPHQTLVEHLMKKESCLGLGEGRKGGRRSEQSFPMKEAEVRKGRASEGEKRKKAQGAAPRRKQKPTTKGGHELKRAQPYDFFQGNEGGRKESRR